MMKLMTWAGIGILLSSCALTDSEVELEPVVVAAGKNSTDRSAGITLVFEDIRRDRKALGAVRNGYMTHTANVVSAQDAGVWVRDSVVKSLRRAGYTVAADDQAVPEPQRQDISVRLYRVYADIRAQWAVVGEVIALVSATGSDGPGLQRTIEGVAQDNDATGFSGSYQEALHRALEDFVLKLITWVDSLPRPSAANRS